MLIHVLPNIKQAKSIIKKNNNNDKLSIEVQLELQLHVQYVFRQVIPDLTYRNEKKNVYNSSVLQVDNNLQNKKYLYFPSVYQGPEYPAILCIFLLHYTQ